MDLAAARSYLWPSALALGAAAVLVSPATGANEPSQADGTASTAKFDGLVVDQTGRPVEGALVMGIPAGPASGPARNRPSFHGKSDEHGAFAADSQPIAWVFRAHSANGTQAGLLRVEPMPTRFTIKIGPTATARGRLINHRGDVVFSGKIAGSIEVYRPATKDGTFPQSWVVTPLVGPALDGTYELTGIIPGHEHRILVTDPMRGRSHILATVAPTSPETIELGDTQYREPLTLAEMSADYFVVHDDSPTRIENALGQAANTGRRLLILVGNASTTGSYDVMAFSEREPRLVREFDRLPVSLDDSSALARIQQAFGEGAEKVVGPELIVFDEAAKLAGRLSLANPAHDDRTTTRIIRDFLTAHTATKGQP